ncbi:MAG: PAS domain-containing protein [Ruminococcus sp.]|nr:PAS domain-containing protein [Ruminococcus sp.]
MNISIFLKSVIDSDNAPVVICDLEHTVVYMNPASIERYNANITGKSIKICHNAQSNQKIDRVLDWFKSSTKNNRVHTYYNDKENKDVYMIALRDESGELIGYYEKHEYRNADPLGLYVME